MKETEGTNLFGQSGLVFRFGRVRRFSFAVSDGWPFFLQMKQFKVWS